MRARQVSGRAARSGGTGGGREGENERGGVVEISGLDNDDDDDNARSAAPTLRATTGAMRAGCPSARWFTNETFEIAAAAQNQGDE